MTSGGAILHWNITEVFMETVFVFILGIIAGGAIAYWYYRTQIKLVSAQLQSELIKEKTIAEQTALNEQKLKDQFSLIAQEVMNRNMEAQTKALQNQNTVDLDKKKQEFNQSFEEIKSTLKNTGEKIQLFEKERVDQYAKIEKQIQTISQQEQKLIQETERLKSALTTSQSVRGRWGELVLRNILQQSGLVSGIDFEEQHNTSGTEGNTLKPDFVLRLPQSRQHLVIDSKASIFESYLESESMDTEAGRKVLHQDFAKRLRDRVKDLSGKEYQKHVSDSLPYVILFVPSESAIRAAFDVDTEIFQWSMERKVFLASPATILPLIMLIGHAWNQHRLSEKANELSQVVSQLGDRLENFVKRLARVQGGLETATKAWNEAIDKSWNGTQSVQKSIEKARELGGNIGEPPLLSPIESTTRAIE
jgi:DNA recombination protein RmuC